VITRRRPAAAVALAGAVALGVAIRAVDFLNCRSLGLDEARLAVNVAARSWLGLLRPLDMDQTAPPLFLWGERLAFLLFGRSDCALRLLPVVAGTAAAILIYPLARRFLDEGEAWLAALVGIFCPLLITYSNAVKQYSVELLAAVVLLLGMERATRHLGQRGVAAGVLAAGALAPWVSLSSVFVLVTAWVVLAALAARRRAGAARLALATAVTWGASGVIAYLAVYRNAGRNEYMRRFWELAFLTPDRPGFAGHAWKSVEDQVWGVLAGDPLADRQPYILMLHATTVLVVLLIGVGCFDVVRARGRAACWWLVGPVVLTLIASMLGVYPIAPRLTLFLLPGLIVLFVAGCSGLLRRAGKAAIPRPLAVLTLSLAVPLGIQAVTRTFSLEPSGHFERLVRELRERRAPGEPVYIFARTLPAWIYYTTDWSRPDTTRLRFLLDAAASTGGAFENAPSRGRVREAEARALTSAAAPGELLGLPSGMEWREVEEHVESTPDSGWAELERRRIEGAAAPGVWVIATAWYAPESELFKALERDASRRTFALLRGGSALVRYEFVRAAASGASSEPVGAQSVSGASFGRRRTTTSAGR
jgi:hypothetical protein